MQLHSSRDSNVFMIDFELNSNKFVTPSNLQQLCIYNIFNGKKIFFTYYENDIYFLKLITIKLFFLNKAFYLYF